MSSTPLLSPVAETVRRHDRDRFATAMFAPPPHREAVMVLYAFNLEIARIRENVHEAMAGMIRLQWWRDVVSLMRNEEADPNPVAGPLVRMIKENHIPADLLHSILDAREQDLSAAAPPDLAALDRYAEDSAGALSELVLIALGGRSADERRAARLVGTAYGLVGGLRALAFHLSIGRVTLPADLLLKAGSSADQLAAGRAPLPAIAQVAQTIGDLAAQHLIQARNIRVSRPLLAAVLPAGLADGHLNVLKRQGWNPFDGDVVRPRPRPIRLAFNMVRGRF